MKRTLGFTLIEVLVAMAITAIVAVLAYGGLDSAVKLSRTAEIEADRLQKMNRVFDILSRDFRQIIARPIRNDDEIEAAFILNDTEQPMLRFTRAGWINPDPERFQRSELQRVNYALDDNKLKRFSWSVLDRYADSKVQEITLLKGVNSLEIRVLGDIVKTDVNGQVINDDKGEWIKTWPLADILQSTNHLTSLPLAIEIIVDVEKIGRIRRVYEVTAGVEL